HLSLSSLHSFPTRRSSDLRTFMEPRFGRDFRHVRVHADSQAERSAQAVQARAYTVGQHIVFGAGAHNHADRSLLAHELTHIVQQDRKSTRLNSSHEWISYA